MFIARMPEYSVLKIAKSYYYNCDIIKTPPEQAILDYVLDSHPAHFMDVLYFAPDRWMVSVIASRFPNGDRCVDVGHLIEDAVAAKDNEVVLFFYLERFNVGFMDHYVGVSFEC